MAAAAQIAFGKVRSMQDDTANGPGTAEMSRMIRSMMPFLEGLNTISDDPKHEYDPAVVDHVFDVLVQIGQDQVRGRGLFSNRALRPEAQRPSLRH